jgi:hypothetical protein
MNKKRGRPPKNPAAAVSDAPKRAYTKRAKPEGTSNEEVVVKRPVTDPYQEKSLPAEIEVSEDETVEPSDNLEDAIAEIWDAFVLRHIMNPKVSGKRETDIFRKYKAVANSIIAAKKAEAEKQNVVEDTE